MTVLNVTQLLTFVAFVGLTAYAIFAPRDANAARRRRTTRLYSGWALVGGAAFMAANAAGRNGWAGYVFAAIALGLLVSAAVVFAKKRE
ncbi:hypothetical protein [Mycolicibacterium sp. CR10]|uniref:hypothetical protein n=1 Tax=Mycolicibacterium sp. CR10 TaxID=2562314 RepID=UPI0010BFD779|nr:hypothetical protein [Mycolicibacterium sp. CR10]